MYWKENRHGHDYQPTDVQRGVDADLNSFTETRFIQANLSLDGIKELLEINILVNQILEFS